MTYPSEFTTFPTWIHDADMIPILLGYDWIIVKNTWTDCPYPTYKNIEKVHLNEYKDAKNPVFSGEMM